MRNFATLTPVEIMYGHGVSNPPSHAVRLSDAIVNINQVLVLRPMGPDYIELFQGLDIDIDGYVATASVAPGTFREGTQLAMSPVAGKGAVCLHWWLTDYEFQYLMGYQSEAGA